MQMVAFSRYGGRRPTCFAKKKRVASLRFCFDSGDDETVRPNVTFRERLFGGVGKEEGEKLTMYRVVGKSLRIVQVTKFFVPFHAKNDAGVHFRRLIQF